MNSLYWTNIKMEFAHILSLFFVKQRLVISFLKVKLNMVQIKWTSKSFNIILNVELSNRFRKHQIYINKTISVWGLIYLSLKNSGNWNGSNCYYL